MRVNADKLMNFLHKSREQKIIVDFHSIDSISRSFAQQYVARKKSSTKQFVEKNTNKNIRMMLALATTKKKRLQRFDFSQWETQQFPV